MGQMCGALPPAMEPRRKRYADSPACKYTGREAPACDCYREREREKEKAKEEGGENRGTDKERNRKGGRDT